MSAKTAVGRFSREENQPKIGRQTIIGVIGASAALLVIGAGIGSQLATRSNITPPANSAPALGGATVAIASPATPVDVTGKVDDLRSEIATLSSEMDDQKREIEALTRASNSEGPLRKEVAVLTARISALEAAVITSDPTLSANLTKSSK